MDDKLFDAVRKAAESHTEPVSEELWARIASELPQTPAPKAPPLYVRYRREIVALAAILLLFLLFTPLLFRHPEGVVTEPQITIAREVAPDPAPIPVEEAPLGVPVSRPSEPKETPMSLQPLRVSVPTLAVNTLSEPLYTLPHMPFTNAAPPHPQAQTPPPRKMLLASEDRSSGAASFSLYASNISMPGKGDNSQGLDMVMSASPQHSDIIPSGANGIKNLEDLLSNPEGAETLTSKEHRPPLTVGLSIRYPLSSRVGLSSGIVVEMLSSRIKFGTKNRYLSTDQTLYYLGIPLSFYGQLYDTRHLSFYLQGGGTLRRLISGSAKHSVLLYDRPQSLYGEDLSDNSLLLSLDFGAGIQYSFTPRWSLYFEPGVSYFISSHSAFSTLYRDKPWQPSLDFGLRYTLPK